MANRTVVELDETTQASMLKELRRSRYGYLLTLHVLLLCARGKTPTQIADFLLCSRTSVYRIVERYKEDSLGFDLEAPTRPNLSTRLSALTPSIRRSIEGLLAKPPRMFGWVRTRWSCQTLALELAARRGVEVSTETMRRWLSQMDYVWKRAKLIAKDADPDRVEKLARVRHLVETLPARAALVFADELDIHLLAKVGSLWIRKGEQELIPTPGKNEKRYLAGALDLLTGEVTHRIWFKKVNGLFIDLLNALDGKYPVAQYDRVYVIADNYGIHKAKAVQKWLAEHPRFELIFIPTYCPAANPIERVFGDVHDKCTRCHKRKLLRTLVADVVEHFQVNGPWKYKLGSVYYEPEVTAAVETLRASDQAKKVAA
jgi:transposase